MSRLSIGCAGLVVSLVLVPPARAQQGEDRAQQRAAGFELYGFVMADAVYDHSGINPQWGDVARPTRLPSFQGQFGEKGNFFFGVRQSRVGIKPHPNRLCTEAARDPAMLEWAYHRSLR